MACQHFVFLVFLGVLCTGLSPGDARVISNSQSSWQISEGSEASDQCSDCKGIVELFEVPMSSADMPDWIYGVLESLCRQPPGSLARKHCTEQLEVFLPQGMHLMRTLKPQEICMFLGLCAGQLQTRVPELQTNDITEAIVSGALPNSGTSPEVHISPQCTFCTFLLKKMEDMLPKDRTEDAIVKLMGEVCDLLPSSSKDQCNNFLDKYGKQLIDFLLSSAAPHTICVLLHLCLFQEKPVMEMPPPSDCESCHTLAVLSRLHLGLNATETERSAFLQSVCVRYPSALPKCELFTQQYGPKLQRVLGKQAGTMETCEVADVCVAVKETRPLGKDPCTWGSSYRCRDIQTALECNSVSFCQQYMWNQA